MDKIAVVGAYGKMGTLVCDMLSGEFEVEKIGRGDRLTMSPELRLVIDFASGASSAESAEFCEKFGVRLIVGATGQTESDWAKIIGASKRAPVMVAGNFSEGILRVKRAMRQIFCDGAREVCILEKHHKSKADKPSGTALEISALIQREMRVVPQILSERGGEEVGTHVVDFYFCGEVVSIEHRAFSREIFARGAVKAAKFLLKQKKCKMYEFEDAIC